MHSATALPVHRNDIRHCVEGLTFWENVAVFYFGICVSDPEQHSKDRPTRKIGRPSPPLSFDTRYYSLLVIVTVAIVSEPSL